MLGCLLAAAQNDLRTGMSLVSVEPSGKLKTAFGVALASSVEVSGRESPGTQVDFIKARSERLSAEISATDTRPQVRPAAPSLLPLLSGRQLLLPAAGSPKCVVSR